MFGVNRGLGQPANRWAEGALRALRGATRRAAPATLLIAGLTAGFGGAGRAQDPFDAFRSSFAESATIRRVAHTYGYEMGGERESFVLDLTGPQPLLRFGRTGEILVLTRSSGSGNDTIYKLENGAQVLRKSYGGGLTFFPPNAKDGAAASKEAAADALSPPAATAATLSVAAEVSSLRAYFASGADIDFDYSSFGSIRDDIARGLAADAMETATLAFERLGRSDAISARLAERVSRVLVIIGSGPTARFKDGTLILLLDPHRGVAGRPSSHRIEQALCDAIACAEAARGDRSKTAN